MLEARDLGVTLGDRCTLEAVSFALRPGEMTAICGPNGAGKSTLLATLAGLLAPQAGQVRLDDAPLEGFAMRDRARAIGYLPQDGRVAWDMDVRRLVGLGRLPHGDEHSDQGREAIAAALSALDLDHLADRPVSRLSGGERARALLARVLAGDPRWILADEPLAALDLAHQLALLARLRDAVLAGVGVVLVLHDLGLAMNHADRVLVLQAGRLVADGLPDEALSAPVIVDVWGVKGKWLGKPGERAFVPGRSMADLPDGRE